MNIDWILARVVNGHIGHGLTEHCIHDIFVWIRRSPERMYGGTIRVLMVETVHSGTVCGLGLFVYFLVVNRTGVKENKGCLGTTT